MFQAYSQVRRKHKQSKEKAQDIARELEAVGEVYINNIKGTRYVGLDVPLSGIGAPLSLPDNLYRLSECKGGLNVLAGQPSDGEYRHIDLAKAPHMLIAGTTGSGKTIFLYSIIASLLSQLADDELELLIIDPKQTDFHFFEGLSCLRGNKVIINAEEAIEALAEINSNDKELRTWEIRSVGCRDIGSASSFKQNAHLHNTYPFYRFSTKTSISKQKRPFRMVRSFCISV